MRTSASANTTVPATFKKRPGRLSVTENHVSFKDTEGHTLLQFPHSALKTQYVSAAGHAKVMLRLAVATNPSKPDETSNFTFGFASTIERDPVKSAIIKILNPASTSGSLSESAQRSSMYVDPKELHVRKSLLQKHKWLAKLHKSLVLSNSVSEEEFWENRRGVIETELAERAQMRASSASWLAELKPVHNPKGTEVKYTLTPQIIHALFLQYPSLRRAYDANVPNNLSEQEFWKRYFSSAMFHRSRIRSDYTRPNSDPIFDKCAAEDEEDLKRGSDTRKRPRLEQFLDLDDGREVEDFGNAPDVTMKHDKGRLSMLRRFNRQSELVLVNSLGSAGENEEKTALDENKLYDAIRLDDLEGDHEEQGLVLNVRSSASASIGTDDMTAEHEIKLNPDDVSWFTTQWNPDFRVAEPMMKFSAVLEQECKRSTDTGATRPFSSQSSSNLPSENVLAHHATGNELLRHFWASGTDFAKRSKMWKSIKKWMEVTDTEALQALRPALKAAQAVWKADQAANAAATAEAVAGAGQENAATVTAPA